MLPATVDLERELYSHSLRDFLRGHDVPLQSRRGQVDPDDPDGGARCAWDIMEPGTDLGWAYHLDALCEHLEAVSLHEIQNLVINIPPRSLKTSIVGIAWPAWEWTRRPSTKFMGSTYEAELAIDSATKSREIIDSDWYQRRWGHVFEFTGDQNVKSYYRNTKGGARRSSGVGGGATGKGADILLCDDPINARDAHNREAIAKAVRWWREVMPSRLNNQKTGRKVVVMQRLHEADVAGWCIENGYTHLNLPLEFNPARRCITVRYPIPRKPDGTRLEGPAGPALEWADPRTEDRQLLHPSNLGEAEAAKLRETLGSYGFAGQYNQEPAPDDGTAMFPELRPDGTPMWPLWHTLPKDPDGKLRRPDDAVVSWDMTFKGKRRGITTSPNKGPDYVVGQLWYRYGAEFFLIDEVRGQWGFSEAKRQVQAFDARCRTVRPFPPRRHVVETKANGEAILDELRPVVPAIVGFNPDPYGDKEARAWAWQPRVEAAQVWLPAKAEWVGAWKHELRVFPNGAHDDRVDAASQAMLVSKVSTWGAA